MDIVDRLDLMELVARYAHAIDERDWDAFTDIFTDDVYWDATSFGRTPWKGLDIIVDHLRGVAHPLAHLLADTVIEELPDGKARLRSKLLTVMAAGATATGLYDDTCVRTDAGWRIEKRIAHRRRESDMPYRVPSVPGAADT